MATFTFGNYVEIAYEYATIDKDQAISVMGLGANNVRETDFGKQNLVRLLLTAPFITDEIFLSQFASIPRTGNPQITRWCNGEQKITRNICNPFDHDGSADEISSAFNRCVRWTNKSILVTKIKNGIENDREISSEDKEWLLDPIPADIQRGHIFNDDEVNEFMAEVLIYVVKRNALPSNEQLVNALRKYKMYLARESKITLGEEGLHADVPLSIKRAEIEQLFQPLRFSHIEPEYLSRSLDERYIHEQSDVGTINDIIPEIGIFTRVVLSGPGGGKSTLFKRLMSAYGLNRISDETLDEGLPIRELLPVLINCKSDIDLGKSIIDIIEAIPRIIGEIDSEELEALNGYIRKCINEGKAIILVDGLDEINESSRRDDFMSKLSYFLKHNANANIIATTRVVGSVRLTQKLASAGRDDLSFWLIRPFEKEDIKKFCWEWHRVLTPSLANDDDVVNKLIKTIICNEKILNIARTPILLTAILVLHKTKQFPQDRTSLYSSLLEILLFTLKASQAYPPIDKRNGLPHLAYLAFYMVFNDPDKIMLTIERSEMVDVLKKAREEMHQIPLDESVDDFVDIVEARSAVLVKRGYRTSEDGTRDVEIYEFQHLTFMEYLASLAITEGSFPGADGKHNEVTRILNCLESFLEDDNRREVIIMTATMKESGYFAPSEIASRILTKLNEIESLETEDREERMNRIKKLLRQIESEGASITKEVKSKIQDTYIE